MISSNDESMNESYNEREVENDSNNERDADAIMLSSDNEVSDV